MIHRPLLAALASALALPGLVVPSLAQAAGDPAHGGVLFKQRCAACHVSEAGATVINAPSLVGVLDRKAASAPGFAYSDALKASGLSWTAANLDAFLTAPNRKVPGTRMVISVTSPTDRADIVAYLSSLKK